MCVIKEKYQETQNVLSHEPLEKDHKYRSQHSIYVNVYHTG